MEEDQKKLSRFGKLNVRCLHPRVFQRRISPRGWSTNESQSSQSLWKQLWMKVIVKMMMKMRADGV